MPGWSERRSVVTNDEAWDRLLQTQTALNNIVKSLEKVQRELGRVCVDDTLEDIIDQMRDGSVFVMLRDVTKARDYTRDLVRDEIVRRRNRRNRHE